MKQGLNLLISGLLLWICAKVLPGVAAFNGLLPLILATVIFFVIILIVSALSILFFTPVTYRNAPVLKMFALCFIITAIAGALALRFLCPLLDGFSFGNFLAALIISIIVSTLCFSAQLVHE